MTLPEFLPAYTSLVIDHAGRVWAARSSPQPDEPTPWDVYSPDGVLLGDIRTPTALRVTQVDARGVTGVWTDELGVQSVRVYEYEVS